MLYEDPFAFRAEYEERYRAPGIGGAGPAPSLVCICVAPTRTRCPGTSCITWRVVRLSLAEFFPRLVYSAVQQVEPEHLAGLFRCPPDRELQSAWRERVEGFHPRTRLPTHAEVHLQPGGFLARAAADALRQPLVAALFAHSTRQASFKARDCSPTNPSPWLASKERCCCVVQDAWYRYLKTGAGWNAHGRTATARVCRQDQIPFDHSMCRCWSDSMFLDGSLHPLAVHSVPAGCRAGLRRALSRTRRHCRPWCSKASMV